METDGCETHWMIQELRYRRRSHAMCVGSSCGRDDRRRYRQVSGARSRIAMLHHLQCHALHRFSCQKAPMSSAGLGLCLRRAVGCDGPENLGPRFVPWKVRFIGIGKLKGPKL